MKPGFYKARCVGVEVLVFKGASPRVVQWFEIEGGERFTIITAPDVRPRVRQGPPRPVRSARGAGKRAPPLGY